MQLLHSIFVNMAADEAGVIKASSKKENLKKIQSLLSVIKMMDFQRCPLHIQALLQL